MQCRIRRRLLLPAVLFETVCHRVLRPLGPTSDVSFATYAANAMAKLAHPGSVADSTNGRRLYRRQEGNGMHRRHVLRGSLAVLMAGPFGASSMMAQQATSARRLGILMPYSEADAVVQSRITALKEGLAAFGWQRGQNLALEERWVSDDPEKIRSAAVELTEKNVDAIVTTGSRVVPILQRITKTVPIIFVGTSDPVGQGFVASTARPGGNTTGFSLQPFEDDASPLMGKLLTLMREVAPDTRRMALMFNPANPASDFHTRTFDAVAAKIGVDRVIARVRNTTEIETAIRSFASGSHGAMVLPSDLTLLGQRKSVVDSLSRYRMPAIFSDRSFVEIGGLMSYSADRAELFRASANYVNRVFRGENPGDLPVQQPTRYELVVNQRTAKALGLTVPQSILIQANEIIE